MHVGMEGGIISIMEGWMEGWSHVGIEGGMFTEWRDLGRERRSDVEIEGTMERFKEEKMEGLRDGGIAEGIEDRGMDGGT